MSLKELMGVAQAQGRGPDSMLVHMSPREVDTLQTVARAHGGSLTVNPSTGLPEAGFLDSILPAVAGIGLSMVPGVGPLAAGAIVGGTTALMSGSLEKGLTAGLGAFGGAGLGAGLGAAGASQAAGAQLAGAGANAAAAGTSTAVPRLAGLAQAAPATFAGTNVPTMAGLAQSAASGAPLAGLGQVAAGAPAVGGSTVPTVAGMGQAVAQAAPATTPTLGQGFMQNAQHLGGGLKQLFSSPGDTLDAMGGLGNVGMNAAMALAPAMVTQPQEEEDFLDPNRGYIRPYTFERERVAGGGNGQRYFNTRFIEHDPVRPEDFRGYAEGGLASITRGGQAWMPSIAALAQAAAEPEQIMEFTRVALPEGDPSGRRFEQSFQLRDMTAADRAAGLVPYRVSTPEEAAAANAGKSASRNAWPFVLSAMGMPNYQRYIGPDGRYITSMNPAIYGGPTRGQDPYAYSGFNTYAQGGVARMVDGPGDGLSDDVPAVIDGAQPAALSTDEFVVPADVVSKLGNGSSKAGAKKLHDMMDRVRMQAHGTKKQQRKVNANKVLPA